MVKHNASVPINLIYLAIVTQLVAPTLVALGYKARYGALALSGFCIIATVLFHADFGNPSEVNSFSSTSPLPEASYSCSRRGLDYSRSMWAAALRDRWRQRSCGEESQCVAGWIKGTLLRKDYAKRESTYSCWRYLGCSGSCGLARPAKSRERTQSNGFGLRRNSTVEQPLCSGAGHVRR